MLLSLRPLSTARLTFLHRRPLFTSLLRISKTFQSCSVSRMPLPKHEYLSDVWRDGIFGKSPCFAMLYSSIRIALTAIKDNKVVFCTGGAGTICSAQVRAMVHLGANACI